MNHLRRAAVAATAAAAVLGIAVPAQAAAPAADGAPQWSIKFDRLEKTLGPYDRASVWSGTCPVPGPYRGSAKKVTPSYESLGLFDLECEDDHTFTLYIMMYDYVRGTGDLPKGAKVKFDIYYGTWDADSGGWVSDGDDDPAPAGASPDGPLYATV
ncbi:hypothetical protein [Kitasatospora sp. NPDC088346]|uniref:hypothetical protein n=1 Tax=Kitasatospora sp. NPDC088346 TaxID=3364073 RepID=UPI0037F2E052